MRHHTLEEPRVGRALLVALLAALLAVGLLPLPLGASEPEDDEPAEEQTGVRRAGDWVAATPGSPGMALWFWPEGRRAYQLFGGTTAQQRFQAYDLDTMRPVAEATLTPEAWGQPTSVGRVHSANGHRHQAAVDRERGRVFVPFQTAVGDAQSGERHGPPCPTSGSFTVVLPDGCVGGVHMLDGEDLSSLGLIPLDPPTVEGLRGFPILRALEYAPADPEMGWDGRVLMVVEETAHGVLGAEDSSIRSGNQNAIPRRNGGNIAYAVAFDPDGMRQEWAVRLEGCRNSREPRSLLHDLEGSPVAVFRAGGPAPALYVGCHGNASQQGVVVRVALDADGFPATMPVRAGDPVTRADPGAGDAGLSGLVEPAPRQEVFTGPDSVTVLLADPVSRRILLRVDDSGEVWWVFDANVNQFLGTVGIGDYRHGDTAYGLDPDTGRLYVAARPTASAPGGLYLADIRRNPLPQALVYPHLADDARTGQREGRVGWTMSVAPRDGDGVTRVYVSKAHNSGAAFTVWEDASEVSVDPELDDTGIVRTLDLDEAEGVTEATFDGTARGFGFRAILIGGAEGAARVGPADPAGWARGLQGGPEFGIGADGSDASEAARLASDSMGRAGPPDPCTDAQREVIVAFVGPEGPAVVDASSARGEAQPVLADVRTREDAGAPVSRCGQQEWQELWRTALVSQPPTDEPGVAWPFDGSRSTCTAADEETDSDSWSDPVAGVFSSRVECEGDEVGGWGQARGASLDGVSVASALSSFRIYRDPQRGLVARVESIARGIDIGGVVRIDTIRGAAESWANGRAGTGVFDPELERELGLTGGGEESFDDPESPSSRRGFRGRGR